MSEEQTSWLVLAHLLRPQGRKGEVLAELLTDFPERFKDRTRVFLAPADFRGSPEEARSAEIVAWWLPVGRNMGRIVLSFSGVESIADAERLSGLDVLLPTVERAELTADEIYIDDLIGCTLFDGEVRVGWVRDVQFPASPDGKRRLADAAPLLIVEGEAGEALIPLTKEFLVQLDVNQKLILMKLPEGLVDLNAVNSSKRT